MSKVAKLDYGYFLGYRIAKIICERFNKFVIKLTHKYEFDIIVSAAHVCITMARYIPRDNDWVEYGRILSINTKTLYLSSTYTSPWLYSLYTKDVMNTYADKMEKILQDIDRNLS